MTDPTPEEIAVRETLFYSRAHIKLVEKWVDAAVAAKLREIMKGITVEHGHCSVCDRVVAAIRKGPDA